MPRWALALTPSSSRHIASSIRPLQSSHIATHVTLPTPAVLIQNVSNARRAEIHVEALSDRSRGVCEVSVWT
jgi:hypothetical protein